MKIIISLFSLLLFTNTPKLTETTESKNLIQIAILLDTSNSMDGLIDQAKAQLWNIANEITNARKDGKEVTFEFALYEYGNDNIPAYQNHVKQVVAFTEDMDLISSHLFALKTNGGEEYCGHVIHSSISELEWKEQAGLKAIYIAGNESFGQGNYPYSISCKEAKNKSIKINTIFCGNFDQGISLEWNNGSSLSLGTYNNINQNSETVHIQTPYDDEIGMLNRKLNETYVSYSTRGQSFKRNQMAQDTNAETYSKANSAKRAIFKTKSNYKNADWDIIDAREAGKDIYKHNDELPTELQSKSAEELDKKIDQMSRLRESIKEDISCLGKERAAFIKKAKQKQSIENPFEVSILSSLRKQLSQAGFQVK